MPQVTGQYCTSDDVIQIAGQANILAYTQLDGGNTIDYNRMSYWMNYVASEIARIFTFDGGAVYPVVFINQDIFVAATLCAKWVVAELYFARGVMRDEQTDTKMQKLKDEAINGFTEGRQGMRFQVVRRWAQATSPQGYMAAGILP